MLMPRAYAAAAADAATPRADYVAMPLPMMFSLLMPPLRCHALIRFH